LILVGAARGGKGTFRARWTKKGKVKWRAGMNRNGGKQSAQHRGGKKRGSMKTRKEDWWGVCRIQRRTMPYEKLSPWSKRRMGMKIHELGWWSIKYPKKTGKYFAAFREQ